MAFQAKNFYFDLIGNYSSQFITINELFRFFYTFPLTYTLGAKDFSCAQDLRPTTKREIKPLITYE